MKLKTFLTAAFFSVPSFFVTLPAFAAGSSISISCPATAPISSTTTCTISGSSSAAISGVSASIFADNLQILKVSIDPAWYGDANDGQIVATTDTNKTGTFTIGTISIQPNSVGSTGTISLSNVIFSDKTFIEFSVASTSTSVSATDAVQSQDEKKEEKSEDTETNSELASLKSLEISGYNIDFSKDKYTYNLNIPENVSSLKITAEPADETSSVTISGNENLSSGSVIKITVENGAGKSIYRIKISTTGASGITEENPNSSPIIPIIIVCGSAILITGICAFFILRKKKSKKKKTPTLTRKTEMTRSAPKPNDNPFLKNNSSPLSPPEKLEKPVTPAPKQPPIPQTPPEPPKAKMTPAQKPNQSNPFLKETNDNPLVFDNKPKPEPKIPPLPPQKPQAQKPPVAPRTQTAQPLAPKTNRPISLNEIPFEQPTNPQKNQKSTTPIIFES